MDYRDIISEIEKEDFQAQLNEEAREWTLMKKLLDKGGDPDRVCTIEDIYALPEKIRAELINGRLFYMEAPTTTHQRIVREMLFEIEKYIRSNGGDCEVFPSPFGVYLNNDDSVYLLPDLSVICDKDKLDEKGCHGAPDWVIEVVSASTGKRDYGIKLFLYRNAGVREYWVIDPGHRKVMVYIFAGKEEEATLYNFEDTIPCSVFPGLEVRLI